MLQCFRNRYLEFYLINKLYITIIKAKLINPEKKVGIILNDRNFIVEYAQTITLHQLHATITIQRINQSVHSSVLNYPCPSERWNLLKIFPGIILYSLVLHSLLWDMEKESKQLLFVYNFIPCYTILYFLYIEIYPFIKSEYLDLVKIYDDSFLLYDIFVKIIYL